MIEYVELRYYTNAAATTFVLLPDFSDLSFDKKYNDVGAFNFSYPYFQAQVLGIKDQSLIGLVIGYSDGTSKEVERYLLNSTNNEKVVEKTRLKSLAGRAIFAVLEDAVVYPSNWPITMPAGHSFIDATPGTIWRTLILRAKSRGVFPNLVETSFSGVQDSAGATWGQLLSQEYASGTYYNQALQDLMDRGIVDARVVGWDLQMFKGGTLGKHIDIGTLEVRPAVNVTEMVTNTDSSESCTAVLIEGEEGTSVERSDAGALTLLGRRRERFVSQGGIADAGILSILGDAELAQFARIPVEETVGIADFDNLEVFKDFDVADWVWVRYEVDEPPVERRIRQIAVSVDVNRNLSIGLTLNSILFEEDVKLRRKVDSYVGGGGTYGSIPDTNSDFSVPNAPAGLGIVSSTFIANDGQYTGGFSASWVAPTMNVDGSGIADLSHFEVQYRYTSDNIWLAVLRTSGPEATLGYSPVTPGREIEVRVRAVDESANVSDWSLAVKHTVAQDVTPPPIPSKPSVIPGQQNLTIVWDGLSSTGTGMSNDLDRVQVWESATNNFVPGSAGSVKIDDFASGGGTTVFPAPLVGQPYYFRLVAIDQAGNVSAASTIENGIPTNVKVSDDTAPAEAPVIEAIAGLGSVRIRWDGINNNDPVTYKVYASTQPNPDYTNSDFLVEETNSTGVTLTQVWDQTDAGSLVKVASNTTVYAVVVPTDEDGDGPVSNEVSGTPILITSADIAANQAWFGTMDVGSLTGGTLSADVILGATLKTAVSGARTETGVFGSRWYDSLGDVVINLPSAISDTNPAQFKGAIQAQALDILGGATFRGSSKMTPGASLQIGNALQPPSSPPVTSVDWETAALTTSLSTTIPVNLQWDTTNSRWLYSSVGPTYTSPLGLPVKDVNLHNVTTAGVATLVFKVTIPSGSPVGGAVKMGNNFAYTYADAVSGSCYMVVTDITTSAAQPTIWVPTSDAGVPPVVGTDGTYLYTASYSTSTTQTTIRRYTLTQADDLLPVTVNGTFDTNITGWSLWGQSATLARTTAETHTGTGSLQVTKTNVIYSNVSVRSGVTSTFLTGVAGRRYRLKLWVKAAPAAATNGRNVNVRLQSWKDPSPGPGYSAEATVAAVSSGWTQVVLDLPANAFSYLQAKADFGPLPAPQSNGEYLRIDDVTITASPGLNYVDQWVTPAPAVDPGWTSGASLSSIQRASFDMGTERFLVGPPRNSPGKNVMTFTTAATPVATPNDNFPTPSIGAYAIAWDGTIFQSLSSARLLAKHTSNVWTSESPNWWVGYAWMDSAGATTADKHETAIGRLGTATVQKRARLSMTSAEVPVGSTDDPNGASFYAARMSEFTVTNKVLTSNVATLTTSAAHGFVVGDVVTITGVGAPYDDTDVPVTAVTSTTFSYAEPGTNLASAVVNSGSVRKSLPSRTELFYQGQATRAAGSKVATLALTSANFSNRVNPITGLVNPANPTSNPRAFPNSTSASVSSQALRLDQQPRAQIDGNGEGRFDGLIPPGTIMESTAVAAPAGWLFADGTAISRTLYPDLAAKYWDGTNYRYGNGDGSTTFNLPYRADGLVDTGLVTGVCAFAAGWTQASTNEWVRQGNVVTCYVSFTRTGAALVLSNPDHVNQLIGTIPVGWRPLIGVGAISSFTGGPRHYLIDDTGNVNMTSGINNLSTSPVNASVETNDAFSFSTTYICSPAGNASTRYIVKI